MDEKRMVSSKGQVVVPKSIRAYLSLKEGDELQFVIRETGEVVISPIKSDNPLSLFGSLPPKSGNTEDFEQVLHESKQERMAKRLKEGKV